MIRERAARRLPGVPMVFGMVAISFLLTILFIRAVAADSGGAALLSGILWLLTLMGFAGFLIVNPNEAQVLQLFGNYSGTVRTPEFWWVNPLTYPRRKVSQRVSNFESNRLKVNDLDGNPIEIAAVVVWKVIDTAEAVIQVNDYDDFLRVQSEAALRNLASTYPYDAHVDGEKALRTGHVEINDRLRDEIQERLAQAGIQVLEARISHLAYAPACWRHAPSPAGRGSGRGSHPDRRGRGWHGGAGARGAIETSGDRSRRGTPRRDGE